MGFDIPIDDPIVNAVVRRFRTAFVRSQALYTDFLGVFPERVAMHQRFIISLFVKGYFPLILVRYCGRQKVRPVEDMSHSW